MERQTSFRSLFRQLPLLAVLAALAWFFVMQYVWSLGFCGWKGIAYSEIDQHVGEPGFNVFFRMLQGGAQVLGWGGAALLGAWLLAKPWQMLRMDQKPSARSLLLAVLAILVSLPLVQYITISPDAFQLPEALASLEAVLRRLEAMMLKLLSAVMGEVGWGALLANLLVFALIPAVCEEMFFRGFLQGLMERRLGGHASVWLVALVFSLMHFQPYGFFARLLLGAVLGYLVYGTRSLWPAVVAHFTFNALQVVAMFAAKRYGWETMMQDTESLQVAWWMAILSAVALGGIILLNNRGRMSNE